MKSTHINPLNRLASGEIVIDRPNSHLGSDLTTQKAVVEAIAQIKSNNRDFIEAEVAFEHVVGSTICVPTSEHDIIVFAQRKGRNGLSRLVRGRQPVPCNRVFLVLKRIGPDVFVLVTGFIGERPYPELFDHKAFSRRRNPKKARMAAEQFWDTHALIFEAVEIATGTPATINHAA